MKISFIIPMYLTEEVDEKHHSILEFWNKVALNHQVIIVDDASPATDTDVLPFRYGNIMFFRIENDIPWNQPAARNYGASVAEGDILVFTDFDHIFNVNDNSDFDVIINNFQEGANGKTYLFSREKDGKLINFHPCSFAILKNNFKGFDERFCGNYGYDDTEFIKRHKPIGILPLSTKVVLNESTHNLKRDTLENKKKL